MSHAFFSNGISVRSWVALSFALATQIAKAEAIYTYTGNDFTNTEAPYTTSDFVTISMTLSEPLPDNSGFTYYTPLSFTANDGYQTLTQTSIGLDTAIFYIETVQGKIVDWNVDIHTNPTPGTEQTIVSIDIPTESVQDYGLGEPPGGPPTVNAYVYTQPGEWTAQSTTPEPSSLLLLGSGLAGLVGMIRRRLRA